MSYVLASRVQGVVTIIKEGFHEVPHALREVLYSHRTLELSAEAPKLKPVSRAATILNDIFCIMYHVCRVAVGREHDAASDLAFPFIV